MKTIVYALLIAGVFRTLFFQPFWIPSGSMKDTLLIGDFLFVNKMAYGYSRHSCPFSMCPFDGRIFGSDPERGDVVVFRHPTEGTDFIKRVIGLPGDRIQMIDGVLNINGTPVELTPEAPFEEVYERQGPQQLPPRCANEPVGEGGICLKDRFTETLPNGVSHSILNIRTAAVGRQHAGIHRARGPCLRDGRQPRQFGRFALSAIGRRRGLRADGKHHRARRPDHVLFGRRADGLFLDLALGPVLPGGRVKPSASKEFIRALPRTRLGQEIAPSLS